MTSPNFEDAERELQRVEEIERKKMQGRTKAIVEAAHALIETCRPHLVYESVPMGDLAPKLRALAVAVGNLQDEHTDRAEWVRKVNERKAGAREGPLAGPHEGEITAYFPDVKMPAPLGLVDGFVAMLRLLPDDDARCSALGDLKSYVCFHCGRLLDADGGEACYCMMDD